MELGTMKLEGSSKELQMEPLLLPKESIKSRDVAIKVKPKRKEKAAVAKVSLSFLFRGRTPLDTFLLIVGCLVAILSGFALPFLAVIMGGMTDSFVNASILVEHPFQMVNTSSGWTFFSDAYSLEDFQRAANNRVFQSLLIGVFLFFSSTIQVFCLITVSENVIYRLRSRYFRSILDKEMAWHDANPQSGTFSTAIFDDFERIKEGIGDKMALAIQYSSQFFGGFLVAFVYDWRLTLIMMSLTPVVAICGAFVARLMSLSALREDKKYSRSMKIVVEVLNALPTVVGFNGQRMELNRYKSSLEAATLDCVMKSLYIGAGFASTFFVMFASLSLAFWVGTDFIADNGMRPETLITVFFSVMMGSLALGRAGPQFTAIRTAQITAAKFRDCFDSKVVSSAKFGDDQSDLLSQDNLHAISMKDVEFAYPTRPDLPILKSFSMDVKRGESVALVGPSGSGKSSVFALLLKLYLPSSGQIKIDDHPLENVDTVFLRRQLFGYVSQEPVLFNTTIMNNLKWACESTVIDEEVVDACKRAQVHEFVSRLPQGYGTVIGGSSSGISLSGGEKQRLAIARALLKKAPILLMDEATSALDSKNESLIQFKGEQKLTKITIAHRLSTVKDVDKVFVLEGGRVAESGTHDELMAKRGVYYRMVEGSRFSGENEQETAGNAKALNKKNVLGAAKQNQRCSSPKLESTAQGKKLLLAEEKATLEGKPGYQAMKPSVQKSLGTESKRLEMELQEIGGRPSTFLSILRRARSEWFFLTAGIFFCLVQGCVFPIFSLFFTKIIETFSLSNPEDKRVGGHFWALMFLLLGAVQAVCIFFQAALFGLSSERLVRRLRVQLFGHILRMDMEFFDQPANSPAKICTRLATDTATIKSVGAFSGKVVVDAAYLVYIFKAVDYRLGSVCASFVSLISGILLALFFGWQMTLVLLALFPLAIFGQSLQAKYLKSKAKQDAIEFEQAGVIALEAVSNIRTVKALAMEQRLSELFNNCMARILWRSRWKAFVQGITYGFASSIYYFLYAASFFFAIWLIMQKVLLPMDVLRTLFAISFTAGTFGFAGSYFPELNKAKFAAGLVFKILSHRPKILADIYFDEEAESEKYDDQGKDELPMEIAVENVDFTYAERPTLPVLKQLSLRIESGKSVGLVGLSGCGKSTLVQLLQRFYDPVGGVIKLDGVDLRELNPLKLRSMIGWVEQEPMLFDRSIRANICYGMEDDDDEDQEEGKSSKGKKVPYADVLQAMKGASIDDFVLGLPQGLETRVGEKGTQLSAGQKQRVAIARALIRRPKILLLDEATSALDNENEQIIQAALHKSTEGRTCLVVAHRLSTIVNADSIAVLDGGQIVEQGTSSELLANGGLYCQLARIQQLR